MKKFIGILAITILSINVHAQSAVTNSGNLQLHTGASLAVFGNFTQSSTGSLVNEGSFYVKANLVNHLAAMNAGTGNMYLNGNTLQTVSGTQAFKTNNLYTNNTAGFSLTNDLRISGIHYFQAGVIQTSTTNFLAYEPGSSYSGASDGNHVNGLVKKAGATDFIFPVGNASILRSIAMTGISASGEFNASYHSATPHTDQLQMPIVRVNPNEYWTLTAAPGITAAVTMNWDHSKVPFQNWYITEIATVNYNGSLWTNQGGSATGNVQTTGSITSGIITSFNMFTLGSKAYPLPVTLVDFTAKKRPGFTELKWISASESDISLYQVERSDNGISFYTIGQVRGKNSGNDEEYIFNDLTKINNKAYYRLRIMEFDGSERFSHTMIISAEELNKKLSLVTNPVVNQIVLSAAPGMEGNFDYTIVSTSGQVIIRGKMNIHNSGRYMIPVQLLPGTYFLEVKNQVEQFMFTISRK